MRKKDASDSLKEAIFLLETKQVEEGRLLREQLFVFQDKLKPVHLVKNIFNDITSSLEVKNSLINNLLGVLSGYLTSKAFLGSKPSLFRKMVAIILEYGVAAVVAKYAETIKIFGLEMLTHLLNSKDPEEIKPEAGKEE
jgi:hypothetical protein